MWQVYLLNIGVWSSYLYRIVKSFSSGVYSQVLKRHDLWFLPSSQLFLVVNFEHVVGEEFAKAKVGRLGLRQELVRSRKPYL